MPLTADNIGQSDAARTDGNNVAQPLAATGPRVRALAIDDNEEMIASAISDAERMAESV